MYPRIDITGALRPKLPPPVFPWGKAFIALAAIVGLLWGCSAKAHDTDPEVTAWMETLMQPDNPAVRCCGEGDAYWCDDYGFDGTDAYCKITDDRKLPHRPDVPVGTKIIVPPEKLKHDRGNPTGHAIVFGQPYLSGGGFLVWCFVQGGGT